MNKSRDSRKIVYDFHSPIMMKFKPPSICMESETKTSSVLSMITSFSWLSNKRKEDSDGLSSEKNQRQSNSQSLTSFSNPLKFIKQLTNEHFLVGNQYKVDVMHIGAIIDDFIDTEYMWSLDFKKGISNITVDIKSKDALIQNVFLPFLLKNKS